MEIKTNLVSANKSDSLRVTVPAHIVKLLDLKTGDQIGWNVKAEKNEFKITITTNKIKDT